MSENEQIKEKQKFSYSKIATFLECPKRYELQYIRNLVEFKENIYTAFGEAIHKAIEITINKKYDFDEAIAIFQKELKDKINLIDPREAQLIFIDEWYRKGKDLLQYFFDTVYNDIKNKKIEVLNTEKYFQYEIIPNILYNGIIDILIKEKENIQEIINIPEIKTLKNGKQKTVIKKIINNKQIDSYKILDWKTGSIQHNENLQLLSYTLPLFFNENILIKEIVYIYLKHKKFVKTKINEDLIFQTKTKIVNIINDINKAQQENNFEMCLDNKKCKYCNVKKFCDKDFELLLNSNKN